MQTMITLDQLFASPELQLVEWKNNFYGGLLAGRTDDNWDDDRSKLLRALVSIANTVVENNGYLVYGVDNEVLPRRVTGITKSFDDAVFQDWAQATFQPKIDFQYWEEPQGTGTNVGIFEIRPAKKYPHVCTQSVGTHLSAGQVWMRHGTRCSLALYDELEAMFAPQDPLLVKLQGAVVNKVKEQLPDGRELCWPTIHELGDRLEQGHQIAHILGSRRPIRCQEHILMKRRKA